ncbi:LysR substrate-binding domain-containing protein [Massilia arenae]|uniref:LysR family transcriptional regulator n=1 Tax=Massilia arenae TaxID=2603288 RepID=A0A5C7G6X0_9BURK|nr:LysR substrate-binding domain-containing protein [Massilia arenae]TXG01703.1 LysR family transcriptional regulator [Massilia arenae]
MRLDLADLQLFLCILDAGSISAGAARANLALASASERLRSIELDAGVMLFERRPRGVVATQAGEALAHHARLILRQQALLKGELRDFAQGAQGTLHLHANTAALAEFMPRQLAPWLAERPRLHVELKERTSADIVRAIAAGLVEAGVVSDAVEAPGLHLQPVERDHLVLIMAPGHRLAAANALRLADVLHEAFVGLTHGSALQDYIDAQALDAGRALALRIRMTTFTGLCEMVGHGVGIGIVPQNVASRNRRRHGLRTIALDEPWARRQLCLCWKDWEDLSSPMRSLLTHLGGTPPAV